MDPNTSQLSSDISAIIATMPDAFSLLTTNIPTTKPTALSTGDLPLLANMDQMNTMSTLSLMLLQQQQMHLMGLNPLLFGGLSTGSIPALDAFSLANLTRPLSQSAIPSPKQSLTSDMRPRAFSSAATLQPSSSDKRRKRSAQDDFAPIGPAKINSVLRGLVETDEEPIAMQLAPVTKSEDERIAQDINRVFARSQPEPPRKRSPEDTVAPRLRPLIRDEDLPDTVGPDSPFRHHPKYQKKNFGLDKYQDDDTDAVACAVASGIWAPMHSGASSDANSSAGNSPKNTDYANNNSPKTFHDMLDQTLARELVAAE